MPKRRRSNEVVTQDAGGIWTDAPIHNAILDNPEADRLLSKIAVERAIARGVSPSAAEKVYGLGKDH